MSVRLIAVHPPRQGGIGPIGLLGTVVAILILIWLVLAMLEGGDQAGFELQPPDSGQNGPEDPCGDRTLDLSRYASSIGAPDHFDDRAHVAFELGETFYDEHGQEVGKYIVLVNDGKAVVISFSVASHLQNTGMPVALLMQMVTKVGEVLEVAQVSPDVDSALREPQFMTFSDPPEYLTDKADCIASQFGSPNDLTYNRVSNVMRNLLFHNRPRNPAVYENGGAGQGLVRRDLP